MKTHLLKLAILFLGAVMLPMPTAFMGVDLVSYANAAGSATSSVSVNATVPQNCNFNGTSVTLAFGTYDAVGTQATSPLDANTTFQLRCTKGSSGVTLGLNTGANPLSSQLRMTDGTDFLNYALYQDAAYTTVWGSSGTALETVPTSTSSSFQTYTIYGSAPAGQNVGVGTYTDTVTITATF